MDEQEFNGRIDEIEQQIKNLPVTDQVKINDLLRRTRERHQQISASASAVADSLSNAMLSIKYMAFDLEATKRENQDLRDRLNKYGENL